MSAIDLLHHVFPWEIASGIERLDPPDGDPSGDDA